MVKAEIIVPLLNANEPEARLVGIHVTEGQAVAKGTLLFTLETTKAAADVDSSEAGFVRLLAAQGDTLSVGDRLALITETSDEAIAAPPAPVAEQVDPEKGELRITKPAQALAKELGVDLAALPTGRLVTEAALRHYAGAVAASGRAGTGPVSAQMIIYGGGGHAKAVLEMAETIGAFRIAGIVDDNIAAGTVVLGVNVLGGREVLPGLTEQGIRLAANGVGGIGAALRTSGKRGVCLADPAPSAGHGGTLCPGWGWGAGFCQCLCRPIIGLVAEVHGQYRGHRLA